MPTATLLRRPAVADDNWEAPARLDEATAPRVARPPFTYRGTGEPHWFAQPCSVLSGEAIVVGVEELDVVFACGCRGLVPASTLVLVSS